MRKIDKENISGEKGNLFYESLLLKGKVCVHCGDGFSYRLHGNRKSFRKTDFTFYQLFDKVSDNDNLESLYLHDSCLVPLFLKFRKKTDISLENRLIHCIQRYDRFGNQLYKKNYLYHRKGILEKIYQKEAEEIFIRKVTPLYTQHEMFSWHCIDYRFKEENREAFELARDALNRKYRKKGVCIKLTPKEVGFKLSA
jgi:hypothetical protein